MCTEYYVNGTRSIISRGFYYSWHLGFSQCITQRILLLIIKDKGMCMLMSLINLFLLILFIKDYLKVEILEVYLFIKLFL